MPLDIFFSNKGKCLTNHNLKNDRDIITKPVDKGSVVAVWDRNICLK